MRKIYFNVKKYENMKLDTEDEINVSLAGKKKNCIYNKGKNRVQ